MKHRLVFCWSGGKDSAIALHRIIQSKEFEVVALLTTCSEDRRISMHGVRVELAEAQADAIGLPLTKVFVRKGPTNEEYSRKMGEALAAFKEQGVTHVGFGDIFLEDLRAWREEQLARVGLIAVFPLWKSDTRQLIHEFIEAGFRSRICCVSDAFFDQRALGRDVDLEFINGLAEDVDPCGENGEFHSFAYAGPVFAHPLRIEVGASLYAPVEEPLNSPNAAKGFWYSDLLLPDNDIERTIALH